MYFEPKVHNESHYRIEENCSGHDTTSCAQLYISVHPCLKITVVLQSSNFMVRESINSSGKTSEADLSGVSIIFIISFAS